MTTHTFSVPLTLGGDEAWVLWDRRLQTYAVARRLFDPGLALGVPGGGSEAFGGGAGRGVGGRPAPVHRLGTRPFEYPTAEALVHALVARGQRVGPSARIAIDTLACSVEAAVGPPRVVGVVDRWVTRRLFCLSSDDQSIELLPQFAHPDHGFHWGDRGPATLSTAAAVVRFALGPLAPVEEDAAALALTVELLADVDDGFELEAPRLCAWYLADESLSAASGPTDRRSLRRLLGSGAVPRTPSASSAAATPSGSGRTGLDRHLEVVEPIPDL
ncbi:MAG: hypothetical protein AAF962_00950 [Actinomycetota bacterium]